MRFGLLWELSGFGPKRDAETPISSKRVGFHDPYHVWRNPDAVRALGVFGFWVSGIDSRMAVAGVSMVCKTQVSSLACGS